MSRKSAREHAFKIIFQMDFRQIDELDAVLNIYFEENRINADASFLNETVKGLFSNINEIDPLISTCVENWRSERISKIDMAIIRLAVYEMVKVKDIPTGVSINEAVSLAKKFGADNSPSFVNGILGAVEKELFGK